jgi:isopentenyldiphosphate isomerase
MSPLATPVVSTLPDRLMVGQRTLNPFILVRIQVWQPTIDMNTEEYLDLVDENDIVIGRKLRSEIYAEGFLNFRAAHAFLINSKGQLWIPRRTAHKVLLPLALDFSAAGHVESGETYDDAFAREVFEELAIDVSKVEHRLLGKLTPKDGVKIFQQVYEIKSDTTPNYNPDDFIESSWVTPQEIVEKIEGGEKAKSDMAFIIRKFYL